MNPSRERRALGWASALLSLAYVGWCYRGLGPREGDAWWQPTGALHQARWLGDLATEPFVGADVAALTLPALALLGVAFATTRSVLPRTLALASVPSSALFGFYGLHAFFPWEFFGGEGSAAILATGLVIGAAAGAPLFAQRWRAAPGVAPALLYGLLAALAIALQGHATGWDDGARFNLSPWPAVPIFGLDIAGYLLAGLQLGIGVALAHRARTGPAGPAPAGWAVATGALLLGAWFVARFGVATGGLLLMGLAFAVPLGFASLLGDGPGRAALGRNLRLGGLLLAVPLIAGRALASGDHAHTRFVLSNQIISALERYYEREEVYPDALDELLVTGDLDAIPAPRIGFRAIHLLEVLPPPRFTYQSMGSSYVLEFASTEWVQCVYSPPWIDEDEPLEEQDLEEPWACPENRPELW